MTVFSFTVAALQMVSQSAASESDIDNALQANLSRAEELIGSAAQQGAQLAVLPENVLTFGTRCRFTAQQQQGWLNALAAMAAAHRLWLVAGSLPLLQFEYQSGGAVDDIRWLESTGLPYATSVVFDDGGRVIGCYRKMHLFDAEVADAAGRYRESDFFRAGDSPGLVTTPWGTMGIGICYDLRFAEYFRYLRAQGAEFVVLPSAFTYTTGAAHWEVLLRARAIENQLYLIGANQGGLHSPERKTWGDSMLVDAWGRVFARAGNVAPQADSQLGEAVVVGEVDLEAQQLVQRKMPVLEHRRFSQSRPE